jgi:AmmeMemoRadiSam system protein A
MPYGSHAVDLELANELIEKYPALFSDYRPAHYRDHCIEVQLPFLHHQLKGNYKIVPIILGTNNSEVCREIALALKPYFNPDNLFIVSTDFSHYPSYDDAIQVDKATKNAILSGNPNVLRAALADEAHKKIPNLLTGLCGWTSVLTLMYMTEKESNLCYEDVEYCNSGDVRHYGERNQVVGYWAIVVKEKNTGEKDEFALTESEKKLLLQEARRTIENLFGTSSIPKPAIISETLQTKCGAFVTLLERGRLRGCIGMIAADKPLVETVRKMAVSAARHDHRFMPVTEEELDDIEIEISVLSPLKLIHDVSEIRLGIHGDFIRQGSHTGVFLPQVATETGWSLDEFLGHCARDKAGIGWDGWKDADVYTFTASVFQEEK